MRPRSSSVSGGDETVELARRGDVVYLAVCLRVAVLLRSRWELATPARWTGFSCHPWFLLWYLGCVEGSEEGSLAVPIQDDL
jgi:hypothetical protein